MTSDRPGENSSAAGWNPAASVQIRALGRHRDQRHQIAKAGWFILVCIAVACGSVHVEPAPPEPIPEPPAPPDAGPDAGTACERAERRLRALDCRQDGGAPWFETPAGAPFADACAAAQQDGRDWNPECIERIASCAELECAFRGECC